MTVLWRCIANSYPACRCCWTPGRGFQCRKGIIYVSSLSLRPFLALCSSNCDHGEHGLPRQFSHLAGTLEPTVWKGSLVLFLGRRRIDYRRSFHGISAQLFFLLVSRIATAFLRKPTESRYYRQRYFISLFERKHSLRIYFCYSYFAKLVFVWH